MFPIKVTKFQLQQQGSASRATLIRLEGALNHSAHGSVMPVLELLIPSGADPRTSMVVDSIDVAAEDIPRYRRTIKRDSASRWYVGAPEELEGKDWRRLVDAVGPDLIQALSDVDLRHLLPNLVDRTLPPARSLPAEGFPIKLTSTPHTEPAKDADDLLGPRSLVLICLEGPPRTDAKGRQVVPIVTLRVLGTDQAHDPVEVRKAEIPPESMPMMFAQRHRHEDWVAGEREEDVLVDREELEEALGQRLFGELHEALPFLVPGAKPPSRVAVPWNKRPRWTGPGSPVPPSDRSLAGPKPPRRSRPRPAAEDEPARASSNVGEADGENPLFGRF